MGSARRGAGASAAGDDAGSVRRPMRRVRPRPRSWVTRVSGSSRRRKSLPPKRPIWSLYYFNFDREAGFTDIGNFIGTFGYGIGAEGRAVRLRARRSPASIVTSVRSTTTPTTPAARSTSIRWCSNGWSGNKFGDIIVGGKFNILSEYTQAPAALALRAFVKLPTGDEDVRRLTGKADFAVDAIVSKEMNEKRRAVRLRRLHRPRRSRTTSRSRTACAGASAPASRRARPCASRQSSTARGTSTTRLGVDTSAASTLP